MFIRDLYEAPAKRIVAVMPGGFHPFHPGHKSLYDWAVKTFGQGNVYVAATNDTAARPFPFDVKKKLAGMAGVPESNFIQVKSPFNAMSYQDIVDDTTALVFVRSEKDKDEHPKPDQTKKNGEPGYLRTYTGKDLNSSNEMGYMAYGPTINFDFSGMQIKSASELRATWTNMRDEDKHKAAALMYGNGHDEAVRLLDKALGGSDKDLDEWAAPALRGVMAVGKIGKFFWNNKWAIGFLTATWKVYPWVRDAVKWANRFLDHPVTQALGRYGLPAVGIAVALYGGTKLYNELIKTKDEKELEKVLTQFEVDKNELEDLIAEFEKLTKEEQPVKDLDENPVAKFVAQKAAGAIARSAPSIGATAGAAYVGAKKAVKQVFKSNGKSNHTVGSARAPGASGYTKPGDETNGLDALAASQKNRSKRIKKEDGTDGVTGQTVRAMARLKARYPHADSDLELMLAAITDNKNLIKATDFDNDEEADDLAARLDKIEKTVKNMKSKKESVKEALVLDKESLINYLQKAITDWAFKEKNVDKLSYVLKHLSGKTISTRDHKNGKQYFTVDKEDILEALRRIHADG